MASQLCIIYDDVFLRHDTGPHHPERPQRLIEIINELRERGVLSRVNVEKAIKASIEDLVAVHDLDYIKWVDKTITDGKRYLDPDTLVSRDSFEVALYAAGSAVLGCKKLIEEGFDFCFTLERPPGHHAGRRGAALGAPTLGFCIFNNIAIAARYLLDKYRFKKVAIFDFDCHHGNGTQEIFYYDNNVLYISTHQDGSTAYPGTGFVDEIGEGEGKGFNVNVPLPPFTGDDLYKVALDKVVERIIREYRPEVLLLSAGFDAHKDDPITSMNLSLNSFIEIAKFVKKIMDEGVTKKIMFVLEGGYGPGLARGVYNIIAYLIGMPVIEESSTTSSESVKKSGLRVIKEVYDKVLGPFWGLEAC